MMATSGDHNVTLYDYEAAERGCCSVLGCRGLGKEVGHVSGAGLDFARTPSYGSYVCPGQLTERLDVIGYYRQTGVIIRCSRNQMER